MEALRNYLFPTSDADAVERVQKAFTDTDDGKIPHGMEKYNRTGAITVLTYDQCPDHLVKIPSPHQKGFKTFLKGDKSYHVEADSLLMRVAIADQMRTIIEEHALDRLYVPKKWTFSHGVIVEKLSLSERTQEIFAAMTPAQRRPYIQQVWTLIKLTGHQDIMNNIAVIESWNPFAAPVLAVFDTEPGGMTLSTLEERKPQAVQSFGLHGLFPYEEKLAVISAP